MPVFLVVAGPAVRVVRVVRVVPRAEPLAGSGAEPLPGPGADVLAGVQVGVLVLPGTRSAERPVAGRAEPAVPRSTERPAAERPAAERPAAERPVAGLAVSGTADAHAARVDVTKQRPRAIDGLGQPRIEIVRPVCETTHRASSRES